MLTPGGTQSNRGALTVAAVVDQFQQLLPVLWFCYVGCEAGRRRPDARDKSAVLKARLLTQYFHEIEATRVRQADVHECHVRREARDTCNGLASRSCDAHGMAMALKQGPKRGDRLDMIVYDKYAPRTRLPKTRRA